MLTGKTAIITGCLQGIGYETMIIFAKNGCNIFACAYKETNEFESKVRELQEKYHVDIIPVYFDMSDNDSIKKAAREIQKVKRPIDILINIAGITRDAIFQMVTMEQMWETFQVNFFSQILLSQYIVKLMLKNGKGSVIFTSSITGMDGSIGGLSYGASKAAIIAAVKTMSEELDPKGIRVNAIAPGAIKTSMTEVLDEKVIEEKLKNLKLHRMGTSEEVSNLILYLASDLSNYVTGQIIRVDGGIG